MSQNSLCCCGCFYMTDTDNGFRINDITHSIEKCGVDKNKVPPLAKAYQQGRDDERKELLRFINSIREVIREPYQFRSSVELVARKEMLESLCDEAEGIEPYDEYFQEN